MTRTESLASGAEPAQPLLETELPPTALRVLQHASLRETMFGGHRTVWHTWGTGLPLFLFHGGSGSWTHWLRNVEGLAASGRQVIAPDMPGFGDSDVAAHAVDADDVVAPLVHGMRDLAQAQSSDVVGFSFGAMVSVLLAGAAADTVRRLALIGPPGLRLRSERLELLPWYGLPGPEQERAHRSNLATLMLHRTSSIDADTVALHAANLRRDRMRMRKLALTDIVARKLPNLACRVDAIVGEQDVLYKDALQKASRLFRRAPNFGQFLVVPNAGHWVQYEEADRFNESLVRLLLT